MAAQRAASTTDTLWQRFWGLVCATAQTIPVCEISDRRTSDHDGQHAIHCNRYSSPPVQHAIGSRCDAQPEAAAESSGASVHGLAVTTAARPAPTEEDANANANAIAMSFRLNEVGHGCSQDAEPDDATDSESARGRGPRGDPKAAPKSTGDGGGGVTRGGSISA